MFLKINRAFSDRTALVYRSAFFAEVVPAFGNNQNFRPETALVSWHK